MQTIQNIFSIFTGLVRPWQAVDAREFKRGLGKIIIGAFFIVSVTAFALSAAQGKLSQPFSGSLALNEQSGFQPGQAVTEMVSQGYLGR